jgi:hypothetical protein
MFKSDFKRASAVAWAFLAVLSFGAGVWAASASRTADQVHVLLENGWKPSADNYAAAKDQYDAISSSAPGDARVPLAMALVAIRNFKHADAGQYLDLVLKAAPSSKAERSSISARRLKIWLAAVRKEDAVVQSGMHDLALLLSGDGDAPSLESREAATWLGGALGYYAGPAIKTLPMGIDPLQSDLTGILKGPLADELLIGKQLAVKQYQQLQSDNVSARADMKAKNEAKRQDDLKQTQAALASASEKLKKLDDKGDKGKDAKGSKGKNDNNSDQQNQKNFQRLMDERQRLMRQIAQEMRGRHRNDGQIARLSQQLNGVNQQLNQMAGSTDKQQALEAEKKRLQNAEDALNAKSKQLSSPGSDDDLAQSPIEARMNSLATYAPVDLEAERQQILDSYAAK